MCVCDLECQLTIKDARTEMVGKREERECIELNNNKCNLNAKRVLHLAKRQVLAKIFAVSL